MNVRLAITQNRNFRIGIRIRNGGSNYYLGQREKLIFGIKKYTCSESYMLRRTLTQDNYDSELDAYILELSSDETMLDTGECFYDTALEREDGRLERIIGCTPMEILRSVVLSEQEQG